MAAFGELYDRHAARLYALCHRILRSVGDAEEVLQDAFVQAWEHAGRFDPARGSVGAWLVMMTRSRALDRLRVSRGRHVQVDERVLDGYPTQDGDPEDSVLEYEGARQMRGKVDALPAPQRVALELAFYEGLTHAEIATVLRQPLGTVKTRIRLALLKLRDGLNAGGGRPIAREPSPFTVGLSQYLAARAAPPAPPPLEGLTVMVVDDDHDTLDLVRTVLESAGASVFTGSSAAAALSHLRESWPDVMLADIRMPGVDGFSLAEEVRTVAGRSSRKLPVVAFTAYGCEDLCDGAGCADFAGYLQKPVLPRRIVETVSQLCGRVM